MTKETFINAFCYEAGMWAATKLPPLALQPWFKLLMAHSLPFWTIWKTALTMKVADEQAVVLAEQWEKEERDHRAEALAIKAQALFPKATITALPDAIVPSVMIIHEPPPEASDAVKALGGKIRITWQLNG